jgi:hypothetical protein
MHHSTTPSFAVEGFQQAAKKHSMRATQKDLRGEAREKSTSGGVLSQYVRLCENFRETGIFLFMFGSAECKIIQR